jgi:hypothetical protein
LGAELEFEKEVGDSLKATSLAAQALVVLTPPDHPIAGFGLQASFVMGLIDDAPERWDVRLIVDKEAGAWRWTGNIVLVDDLNGDDDVGVRLGYRLIADRHLNDQFRLGIEASGEFGSISDSFPRDDQAHLIGPRLGVRIPISNSDDEDGEAEGPMLALGALFGVNKAAPNIALRLQVEFEF